MEEERERRKKYRDTNKDSGGEEVKDERTWGEEKEHKNRKKIHLFGGR